MVANGYSMTFVMMVRLVAYIALLKSYVITASRLKLAINVVISEVVIW